MTNPTAPGVSSLGSASIYARREPVVLRRIAGEHLLVPIRRRVSDLQAIFGLTGVAAPVWEMLDGTRTLGEVRDAVVARFDVSPERAWTDLCRFVGHLEESGLVERRG